MDGNIRALFVTDDPPIPASEAAIRVLRHAIGWTFPPQYIEFLRWRNGWEGFMGGDRNYLRLDSAEWVAENAATEEALEFLPGLVVIGSNGGGEAFAFDRRKTPDNEGVVMLPWIGYMPERPEEAFWCGRDFFDFLRNASRYGYFDIRKINQRI